jgi:HSP20 family protein
MKTRDKERKALQRHEVGFFDEMDRAFDTLLNTGWMRPFRETWPEWAAPMQTDRELRAPRVDLVEHDTEFLIRAELPGIEKKDLHLDLTGNVLTIRGERKHEEKVEEGDVYRAEILRGSFSRTIRLPTTVKADEVAAEFDNGMLEVHLPKVETTPRQKIEVK